MTDVDNLPALMLRLGTAALVGLLLGLDPEMRGHDAGVRTHALVALSSAAIMCSALIIFAELRQEESPPDPLRVIQGLAQAIGFIAGGLIFVRGANVHNLTTATNIWMSAALGIAAGAGQFRLVIVGTFLTVVLLTLFRLFKRWLPTERRD